MLERPWESTERLLREPEMPFPPGPYRVRPSGRARRLAEGPRLAHGHIAAEYLVAAGQGRKPEARPRHDAAGLRLIPEHGAVDAVG